MNNIIQLRGTIRNFISRNTKWLVMVWRGLVVLTSLFVINYAFGFISILKNPAITIGIAIACSFIPSSAGTIVVVLYGLVQLSALSSQVSMAALVLLIAFYGVTFFYRAKYKYNVVYIPITYQLQIPYVMPMQAALFGGGMNEISTVMTGGIFSFFLKAIKDNSSAFLDETVEVTVTDIILKKMIANQLFYIYIMALVVMFLVVYFVKNAKIKNSWYVAITFGVVAEFVIMLAGILIFGSISDLPILIIANLLCLIVGVVSVLLFRDLDYKRVEYVEFEDDEYVYYVTAIPKIEVAREEKTVQRITDFKTTDTVEDSSTDN